MEDIEIERQIKNLQEDLANIPSHVFGEHLRCNRVDYIECTPSATEINYVTLMKECGVYDDILRLFHRLMHNASSLLRNMSTNDAEHYNSVLCKFIGGKRVNFSLGRQYESRCEAAAISFNAQGKFHDVMYRTLTDHSPRRHTKQYIKQVCAIRKRRAIKIGKGTKRRLHQTTATKDADYGPEAAHIVELTEEELNQKKIYFLEIVEINLEKIREIERTTIGQASNPKWLQERSIRLTASRFGEIIKMRATTSTTKKVESIISSKFTGNAATKYGIANEPLAISDFEKNTGMVVDSCGLFVCPDYGYLAASPDGIISHDSIIEIKCPYNLKNLDPIEGIENGILKYATVDEGNLNLNRNHNYYYQVQGQLNITGREHCYFVIWSQKGIIFEKVILIK